MFPQGACRHPSEKNWSSIGVRKWQKMKSRRKDNPGKLSQHFLSQSHKAALDDYVHFMSAKSRVDLLLDMETRRKEIQVKENMENNRYIIKLILDLCRTMAKQGIPFRGTYRGSKSDENGNVTQLLALISAGTSLPRGGVWGGVTPPNNFKLKNLVKMSK